MRIGYHDHNEPSGLAPAIVLAREQGINTVYYENLPKKTENIPTPFIINPLYSQDERYWTAIRDCIDAHSKTKFVLLVPGRETREQAQRTLAQRSNVEFLTMNGSARLAEILGVSF